MNKGKTMTFNLGKAQIYVPRSENGNFKFIFRIHFIFWRESQEINNRFPTLSTFKGLIPFYRLHFKAMFIFGIFISQFQSLSLTSLRLEHQVKYRSKVLFWRFKGHFIFYFSFIILFALFYFYYSDEYLLRPIYVVRSKVVFEMDLEANGRRISRPVLVELVIRMVLIMVSRLVNGSVKMVWMRDVCLSYFNENQIKNRNAKIFMSFSHSLPISVNEP